MDAITSMLYVYWACDIALALYGWPTTLNWVTPPKLFTDLFHYGKCRDGKVESSLVKAIEIPKSWFKHYYFYGFLLSSFMVTLTYGCFLYGYDIIGRQTLVDLIGTRPRVIDEYAVMMVCAMMFIQHSRRIYECLFVSVYSKGTMNVLHYILGMWLYSTVQLCAICDGPSLTPSSSNNVDVFEQLRNLDLTAAAIAHWNKLIGGLLFIFASYYHHQSHVMLANLRKHQASGQVLHRQHVIPRGGLFEYLSAPHFVCEILIYVAMGLVALRSFTFWMGPVLFTVTNQSLMIHETHKWYKKTFRYYPDRYYFIPYLF